jgi:queuine tRNA-ribosyltransferase
MALPHQGLSFTLQHTDIGCKARAGVITTQHGKIHTPIFMPVGTVGTVKAVEQSTLQTTIGAEIILGNTYHLYLRPGTIVLKEAGGLHRFMSWPRPILTDSGGYQVYSLTTKRKINEAGVTFRSHIDGSYHTFTPENVVDIQRYIGSDIMMALDECTPLPCTYAYAKASMELTHRWLQRGIDHFNRTMLAENAYQSFFPIVQGSIYPDLRQQSAETIAAFDQPGYAIGGVCHPTGQLYEVTGWVCEILPTYKPRYLMGVGTPQDLLECIALGVDMFDCVMPTRCGRNGRLFTTQGIIHIKNNCWKKDFSALDEGFNSPISNGYTKGYLHHLFKANELLAYQLASMHNLTFYMWLVKEARKQILANTFLSWKASTLPTIMQRY